MSYKLLVRSPKNEKVEIKLVEASGSYFDPARVLWDERLGPLPSNMLALYDEAVANMDARSNLEKSKKEAREYLSITDWYIIREIDSGKPCPQDIRLKRTSARTVLNM